jgi:hypothetical protein
MADRVSPAEPGKVRGRWIDDVADGEVVRFASWVVVMIATAAVSTAKIVSEAEAHSPVRLSNRYVVWWGVITLGSIVLLSILGGLLVFRLDAKWDIAATWPWLGGLMVGAGAFVTLSAMGQTDPGSVSCTGSQPCDTAFGLGAALLSVAAAIPIGIAFVGAYGLRRFAHRLHRSAN